MINVGITGQSGFIGTHLYNTLSIYKEEFRLIPFKDEFFLNDRELNVFVSSCDTIVHLAAVNRHADQDVIYLTNIRLVKQLIEALEKTGSKAHVLFSSSTQEECDNLYGKSKREGRELFEGWARHNNAGFTGFIIPNVFGPFGNPYYNSVIATFSHQLTHNENPRIEIDTELNLIYINELVKTMITKIREKKERSVITEMQVPHTSVRKVSEILNILVRFDEEYRKKGIIPEFTNVFDIDLFNTYRSFIDPKTYFPVKNKTNIDPRGMFTEILHMKSGGQVSFSITVPDITRGNHYHMRKIERFFVIKGEAVIQLRRIGTSEIFDFYLSGKKPAYVDIPVWYTHNLSNIGTEDLYTVFWINEFYNPRDPDTFFEKV
jgi:UDP-2-acetamido-2,6-beta-L-arabino-hexul-4-ose reductase